MWEFSISVSKEHHSIKQYLFGKLQDYTQNCGGVVTVNEKQYQYEIIIAVNAFEQNRLTLYLQDIISESVCYFLKKEYLTSNLKIMVNDEMAKQAFIFALLFFDKETDKYIVNKNIYIDKKIDIVGFYNFKLQTLKGKWKELIEIANQNEIYLYSDDTFMELIKFLVDNIEVKSDVVNIMGYEDSYDIYDSKFDRIVCKDGCDKKEESIVAQLITMCPKNINIYCSEILPNKLKVLLCRIFEKRVRFLSKIN